jgi:hypothetical protein
MTEPKYQRDEIVDITIRGARVVECKGGSLGYEYATVGNEHAVYASAEIQHEADSATITRVVPAAGAPMPGELWQDSRGMRWLVTATGKLHDGGTGAPRLASDVHRVHGPLVPVYRDPADGGEEQ